MTSELRVDNLKGSTTGGSINVLGEGTSATTNLQQGLSKSWITFTSAASFTNRDSFNVSSLGDGGAGSGTGWHFHVIQYDEPNATRVNMTIRNSSNSTIDCGFISVNVNGDLA